jgi:fluoride ion exporter CrcB/FEX
MGFGVLMAIAIGGGIGSLARHYLSTASIRRQAARFRMASSSSMCWAALIMGIIVELGALKLNFTPECAPF